MGTAKGLMAIAGPRDRDAGSGLCGACYFAAEPSVVMCNWISSLTLGT